MKVCVMGLGYIGFPTACVMARAGHQVLGVDVKQSVIDKLNAGQLHIVNEDGLEELALSVLQSGALRVSTTPEPADVFILAVPTPFQHHDGQADLKAELERPETAYQADLAYVAAATRAIASVVKAGNLVVVESTVPPHTTDGIVLATLQEAGIDTEEILFAHAPERVLPGNIVHELVHNNRIVGGMTRDASKVAVKFYQSFVQGQVVETDATTAELVKLMENTFRDVNIALANEFARVCEHLGVNVWEAIKLANLHPRVNFLRPGPGVGGHCIAVDPYFVVEAAPHLTSLIQTARRVNRRMPLHVMELYAELTRGTEIRKVAVLGASYKANVGDDRESPALEVAHLLAETGVEVAIHDPHVDAYNTPLAAIFSQADVVMLLTDHKVYDAIDPLAVAGQVHQHLLLDTRGQLNAEAWRRAGFQVSQLGSGAAEDVVAHRA